MARAISRFRCLAILLFFCFYTNNDNEVDTQFQQSLPFNDILKNYAHMNNHSKSERREVMGIPLMQTTNSYQSRQNSRIFPQMLRFGSNEPELKPVSTLQKLPPAYQRPPHLRQISENDLYFLGAIEKLVYRVDYLESRLRRTEQLIYYLMAGNKEHEVRDPCPANFTRANSNCYHINTEQQLSWKSANAACKALNANLVELEKEADSDEIKAILLNNGRFSGKHYWVGALNPGLLWIWSNSAKPVNTNINLASLASPERNITESIKKSDNSDAADGLPIKGKGRCLLFSFNTSKHSYEYFGEECALKHYYICMYRDMSLDNKIKKLTRSLQLEEDL